jgi:hypothetical protein
MTSNLRRYSTMKSPISATVVSMTPQFAKNDLKITPLFLRDCFSYRVVQFAYVFFC